MLIPLIALTLSQATPVDAAPFKDKLVLLTDGKGHYVAFDPATPYEATTTFYGDGKTFARIPVHSGGRNGSESWSIAFWDPRVRHGGNGPGMVEMKDSGKKHLVSCSKKETELSVVPKEESKKLLATATFTDTTWTRQPEKLLRDDTGVYYLVDRFRSREPSDRRDFRVFVGHKGAMKQMPLKEIVDDTQGMVLATKTGDLRLVTKGDKFEGKWIVGKKETVLAEVNLDNFDTIRMVYVDLGPYSGLRLGTPCDDLM
ncbi:MAG: hypothetical protein ACO1OB_13535 [Archangium sp.]